MVVAFKGATWILKVSQPSFLAYSSGQQPKQNHFRTAGQRTLCFDSTLKGTVHLETVCGTSSFSFCLFYTTRITIYLLLTFDLNSVFLKH